MREIPVFVDSISPLIAHAHWAIEHAHLVGKLRDFTLGFPNTSAQPIVPGNLRERDAFDSAETTTILNYRNSTVHNP